MQNRLIRISPTNYSRKKPPVELTAVNQSNLNLLLISTSSLLLASVVFCILSILALTLWNSGSIPCTTTTTTTGTNATTAPTTTSTTTTTTTTTASTTTSTSGISQYITDLYLMNGVSTTMTCPNGYTKIGTDLNLNAGGYVIYLCYTYNASYAPITGISGYDDTPVLPFPNMNDSAWLSLPNANSLFYPGQDCNQEINFAGYGYSPSYVYLFIRRDATYGPPIKSIMVYASPTYNCPPTIPAGWTALTVDLNEGGIGSCLYLAYQ